MLLWFCWYGFNAGSLVALGTTLTGHEDKIGLIGVNVTLGAAGGAFMAFLINYIRRSSHRDRFNPFMWTSGALTGLVGITGCCNNITPLAALFIGLLSGVVYYLFNAAFSSW